MQRHCAELTDRLLKSLDKDYNVVDMGVVVEVITVLEKTTVTKEVLESTRLGKHINELRRKTGNEALAKRAKDLVRRWRDAILPAAAHPAQQQPTPADPAPPALNGATKQPRSPALRSLVAGKQQAPQSPKAHLRPLALKPQSPLCRANSQQPLASFGRISSPALSNHSDKSRSPIVSPAKSAVALANNHRTGLSNHRQTGAASGPDGKLAGQNHAPLEAVPRTHSSNKRLRKNDDDDDDEEDYAEPASLDANESESCESTADRQLEQQRPPAKRPRLNGDNAGDASSIAATDLKTTQQVPSSTPLAREEEEPENIEPAHEAPEQAQVVVKKRGRKKGSKNVKKQQQQQALLEDRVKEKLASISRNPKLKTTQELLADLQARGSHPILNTSHRLPPPNRAADTGFRGSDASFLAANRHNNNSHKAANNASLRHVRIKPKVKRESPEISVIEPDADSVGQVGVNDSKIIKSSQDLTVEEILAQLPPLDVKSIVWRDPEENSEQVNKSDEPREITERDLERLHSQCTEGLNGNFQTKLGSTETKSESNCEEKLEWKKLVGLPRPLESDNDKEFREWHEMLARPSCDGQILHILPYVIID